jgi:hypothetical protein
MSKSSFRLLVTMQAFLFTIFGVILKNMDDSLGNKLLWTGVILLGILSLRVFVKFLVNRTEF